MRAIALLIAALMLSAQAHAQASVTSPARVRMCEAPDGCGWLFYDETRNGTRRWCSMKDCGNRAKARRHYARNKATE